MKSNKLVNSKAVTLTELLVVLAIVALLATIAVPVYVNQLQRARIATARYETRQIAEAQQAVAITHGYLVPIHILDNVPNRDGSGLGGNTSSFDNFDNIANLSQLNLVDISQPLDATTIGANQADLGDGTTNNRVAALIETWQGPFLNPKRIYNVGQDLVSNNFGDLTQDLVVDPWGNPYLMYTDLGQAASNQVSDWETFTNIPVTVDDLDVQSGGFEQDRFDRFAVVSFGPDGETSFDGTNPLIQGDDIFYTFSAIANNESRYQFF